MIMEYLTGHETTQTVTIIIIGAVIIAAIISRRIERHDAKDERNTERAYQAEREKRMIVDHNKK